MENKEVKIYRISLIAACLLITTVVLVGCPMVICKPAPPSLDCPKMANFTIIPNKTTFKVGEQILFENKTPEEVRVKWTLGEDYTIVAGDTDLHNLTIHYTSPGEKEIILTFDGKNECFASRKIYIK